MTDRSSMIEAGASPMLATPYPGRNPAAYQVTGAHQPSLSPNDPPVLDPGAYVLAVRLATGSPPVVASTVRAALVDHASTPGLDFFERFHVLFREYAFGNILTTQTASLIVFNAHRRRTETWDTFANGAGVGVSLLGQPSLPVSIEYLQQVSMTLQVETVGPPQVNATLDFTFGDGGIIQVPISLTRLVLLGLLPEAGYEEFLEFLTSIHAHSDGTEQRVSVRRYPRQGFVHEFRLSEGPELQRFDNVMFDWHARLFGVPVWHDQMRQTVASTIGALTVSVDSTADVDLRVDGLAVLWNSESSFDVLEVESFTSNTITFKAAAQLAHAVGTRVVPVRLARVLDRGARGSRAPKGLGVRRVEFLVDDNAVALASTAGFATLNSKVLLTDGNVIRGVQSESSDRPLIVLDNETGAVSTYALQDRDRRVSTKTFFTIGRAAHMQVRRLMHALRGRQVSFYLPTFYEDMTLFSDLANGSSAMEVVNVGYARFVRVRQPKKIVRVVFNNGNSPLIRTILTAVETDASKDTITLDAAWPSAIPKSTVSRIEFLEEVRADSDTIRIVHEAGFRASRFSFPVKAVLE